MLEDYNDFLILAIPFGIMIVPVVIGFIYKYTSKPRLPKKYYDQFDSVKWSPPKELSPFLASYIIDSRITHSDITVLLYGLLKKNIIHVLPIGKGKYNRDYVFIFQDDIRTFLPMLDTYEKILAKSLWSSDNYHAKNILKDYPYLKINYPICRFSKLKKPSQKLITEARKELITLGYLKKKKVSRLKVLGLLLLIPVLIFMNSRLSNDLEISVNLSAGIIAYLIFIYSYLPLTKKGTRIKKEIAGFKHYLNKVEGERMVKIRTSPDLYEDEYHLRYFDYILAFNVLGQYASPKERRKMEHTWYDPQIKRKFNDLGEIGVLLDHLRAGNKNR